MARRQPQSAKSTDTALGGLGGYRQMRRHWWCCQLHWDLDRQTSTPMSGITPWSAPAMFGSTVRWLPNYTHNLVGPVQTQIAYNATRAHTHTHITACTSGRTRNSVCTHAFELLHTQVEGHATIWAGTRTHKHTHTHTHTHTQMQHTTYHIPHTTHQMQDSSEHFGVDSGRLPDKPCNNTIIPLYHSLPNF